MEQRFDYYAKLTAVLILVGGCFLVLKPFLTATLLAAVVCVSTWPLYLRLLRKMNGQQTLAALLMTMTLSLLVILPLALVAYNLADNVTAFYNEIKMAVEFGPASPPAWLKDMPIVGTSAHEYWQLLASSKVEMDALTKRLLEPTKNFLLAGGIFLGQGVMDMSLAAFVSFFFYRDGMTLLRLLNVMMDKIIGVHTENVLGIINSTVQGVMYGLLGTALAQGIVATIGFAIAGVPAALMLGTITALLSLIPVGPPLIWVGAAYLHSGQEFQSYGLLWTAVLLTISLAAILASRLFGWWRIWRARRAVEHRIRSRGGSKAAIWVAMVSAAPSPRPFRGRS